MVTQVILLIAGIICLAAALALVLWPRWVASVPAFAGMLLLHCSYYIDVPTQYLVFWGVAALITACLYYLTPSGEPDGHRASNLYVGLTAIAGGMLGILLNTPSLMVLGVIVGAAVGQLAYSRTPAGKWMLKPSTLFVRYFAAKCLPVIVAVAIVCIAVMGMIIE